MLVIDEGAHALVSSSLPAGKEQCGCPGLLEPRTQTEQLSPLGAGTLADERDLMVQASDACLALYRSPFLRPA